MASKSNIRSMRFSDEILKLIEAQPGDSFTAKFELLVRTSVQELPEKKRELKQIQERIERERDQLKRIEAYASRLGKQIGNLDYALQSFSRQVNTGIANLTDMIDGK